MDMGLAAQATEEPCFTAARLAVLARGEPSVGTRDGVWDAVGRLLETQVVTLLISVLRLAVPGRVAARAMKLAGGGGEVFQHSPAFLHFSCALPTLFV